MFRNINLRHETARNSLEVFAVSAELERAQWAKEFLMIEVRTVPRPRPTIKARVAGGTPPSGAENMSQTIDCDYEATLA
jgi:hypothetical protein